MQWQLLANDAGVCLIDIAMSAATLLAKCSAQLQLQLQLRLLPCGVHTQQ
jgi:hypothetical protein